MERGWLLRNGRAEQDRCTLFVGQLFAVRCTAKQVSLARGIAIGCSRCDGRRLSACLVDMAWPWRTFAGT